MRRPYIDWLRGVAVVIMIHAHAIDAWTRPADKELPFYEWVVRVNGMGAPLFLFLAGLAVVLAAGAGQRRHGDVAKASWAVQRRGWEIFGLAFLFRIQAWLVSPGATLYGILKVDILNVMGPSIACAAWLWGRTTRDRARFAIFAARGAGARRGHAVGALDAAGRRLARAARALRPARARAVRLLPVDRAAARRRGRRRRDRSTPRRPTQSGALSAG